MGTGGKPAGLWSWPVTSASAEVKKIWIYISTPQTTSWRSAYLVKHRDNFFFHIFFLLSSIFYFLYFSFFSSFSFFLLCIVGLFEIFSSRKCYRLLFHIDLTESFWIYGLLEVEIKMKLHRSLNTVGQKLFIPICTFRTINNILPLRPSVPIISFPCLQPK
jgi:hypothetical protein